MVSSTPEEARPARRTPRADGQHNHHKLIDAAEAVFLDRGIDAPLEDVARAADVGIATLYRHFPHRIDLLVAVYERAVEAMSDLLDEALVAESARAGVLRFLRGATEYQSSRLMLAEIVRRVARHDPTFRPGVVLTERLVLLVDRGIAEGFLRPEVRGSDLAVVPMMLSVLGRGPGAAEWRERQLRLILSGLGQPSESPDVGESALGENEYDHLLHGVDRPDEHAATDAVTDVEA